MSLKFKKRIYKKNSLNYAEFPNIIKADFNSKHL